MKAGQKYISPTADIVQYPHFEAVVVKIQKSIWNQMNESVKAAVRIWKTTISSSGTTRLQGTCSTNNISEWMTRRRKRDEETSNYFDRDFIMGSVAEVKRVFVFAKYVLSENRCSVIP